MEFFRTLWLRLTKETAPFFKVIVYICATLATIAGAIDALQTMGLSFLPIKIVEIAHNVWMFSLAVGITAQATLKEPEKVLEK